MVVTPSTYIEAPAVTPLPFGILDAVGAQPMSPHLGMGIEYQPEFCGPAWPTVAMCITPPSAGSISISVAEKVATITGTGEPAGTGYTIDWGDTHTDTGALDGQTNTYAAAGTYLVTVSNPSVGYHAKVSITVNAAGNTGPFTANSSFSKIDTDGVPLVTGEPFAVYHMQKCRTVGSLDDAARRARRSLELGEGRAVEQTLAARMSSAATDITPSGTAVDMVDGLALLEEYTASNYGGVATMHLSRSAVTRLAARASILRVGGHLETVQGSLVVAGAGYAGAAGPSAAAAGAGWMFATGTVVLYRGDIIESGGQIIHSGESGRGSTSSYTNEYRALAERPYVAAWECVTAAVEVTMKACCP